MNKTSVKTFLPFTTGVVDTGRGGGRGTKSYHGEKAWSSTDHSILSSWPIQKENFLEIKI
jgi:hypothetical protein